MNIICTRTSKVLLTILKVGFAFLYEAGNAFLTVHQLQIVDHDIFPFPDIEINRMESIKSLLEAGNSIHQN